MNELKLDYFISKDKKIYQHPDHFHFNTDTKLLAQFLKVKKNERILDIGTNNAALLYACDDVDVKELVGVEILEEACQIAQMNTQFFKHDIRIVHSPIQDFEEEEFDVIVSNPPYFKMDATHPDIQYTLRQYGRVEINLSLEELIKNAARLLKSNGRFYFVHRPNRLNEIAHFLFQYNFHIKTLQIAYDRNIAKSILIEAIKESNCDCNILQPLFIK